MELYYQKLVDHWLKLIWGLVAIVSVTVSYIFEKQLIAWIGCFGMTLLSMLLIVPEWSIWQKHRTVWLGVPIQSDKKKDH